jgi:hypothetical protein
MPKITPYKAKNTVIRAKTTANSNDQKQINAKWWLLDKQSELAGSLFGVVKHLKENQGWRQKQAALYARLYGNMPIANFLGVNLTKLNNEQKFPNERPTMNVVQSCTDALVSRMVQSKPKPMFLTSGGDYKNRKLSKELNRFVEGEFYQTRAYEIGEQVLRLSSILGDGVVKIYETDEKRVGLENVLCTELFVDEADGMYGHPQQMHQLKIVDRDVVSEMYPDKRAAIMRASPAYLDTSSSSQESIVSQIMIVESWHLRSGANAKDGKHVIAIDNAVLTNEDFEEDDFPFVKLPYAPRVLGFWSQGLSEQLMGLQNEINRLLYTIQVSLHLCGVPKWLVEDGSKVVSAHINNQIGGIIRYQGIAPTLQVPQCIPQELYAQLERLIQYAYQQSGISMLAAASQKPAGLNSGTALREYDDLQSDRFAYLSQRYEKFYLDLAHKMFRLAKKIAKRDGEYETIYPGKNSIIKVSFPEINLKDEDFIIQAYPVSAFSKNPAQRKQEIIDDMQAGLIDPQEGRRLLDYPDLQQVTELLNAPEERILKILDEIVEDGKYTPPDPFIDLSKAKVLVVQYLNKFLQENLEEEKAQLLRDFSTQLDAMQAAANPPPMAGGVNPQASPMPPPTSPMIPNVSMAA